MINYQGRIVVGSTNFDGTGQFKFAFVNSDGTQTFWSNNGSSTNGSEPTAAISLPVSKGLYSVLLGDTSVTGMSAIPPTVFTNPDVRLRVWFNDGARGFQKLNPDQRMAAAGYALNSASVADGAVSTAKIADGSVTPEKLQFGSALRVDPNGALYVDNVAALGAGEAYSGSGVIEHGFDAGGSNFSVQAVKATGLNSAAFERVTAISGLAAAHPLTEVITSERTRTIGRGPARAGQFTIERDAGLGRLYFQEWFSTANVPLFGITITFKGIDEEVTSSITLTDCQLLSYKLRLPQDSLGLAVREVITIRYAKISYP